MNHLRGNLLFFDISVLWMQLIDSLKNTVCFRLLSQWSTINQMREDESQNAACWEMQPLMTVRCRGPDGKHFFSVYLLALHTTQLPSIIIWQFNFCLIVDSISLSFEWELSCDPILLTQRAKDMIWCNAQLQSNIKTQWLVWTYESRHCEGCKSGSHLHKGIAMTSEMGFHIYKECH